MAVLGRRDWLAFRYMQRQRERRNRFRAKVNNRHVESIPPGCTLSPRRNRRANTTSRHAGRAQDRRSDRANRCGDTPNTRLNTREK